jgi:very-short-patch-repair endonuclease
MRKLNTDHTNIPPLEKRRRELRNNPTPAEALLWKYLSRKQLLGKKFRRQYSVGKYVVDFYCHECTLAIELDGAPHFELLRQYYEAQRTAYLTGMGMEILRFENKVLYEDLEGVLETIREAVRRRTGG